MAQVHQVNGTDYARHSSDDAIDSVDKIPTLTQVRSAGSISLTPELFEKVGPSFLSQEPGARSQELMSCTALSHTQDTAYR
jgi:hypothetical protein